MKKEKVKNIIYHILKNFMQMKQTIIKLMRNKICEYRNDKTE